MTVKALIHIFNSEIELIMNLSKVMIRVSAVSVDQ